MGFTFSYLKENLVLLGVNQISYSFGFKSSMLVHSLIRHQKGHKLNGYFSYSDSLATTQWHKGVQS